MSKTSKAVLITGAAGGIGKAMCSEFRDCGYFVIATDRNKIAMDSTAELQLDIKELCLDESVRQRFSNDVRQILTANGLKLTALINNAAAQILNKTDNVTVDDWNITLQTNLIAPFLLIQSFLPELESNQGSVVNVASIHATATKPEFVCYSTSKSALVGMTKSMAVDLGGRIRVNAICPAATATPMLLAGFDGKGKEFNELAKVHPIGRIAETKEVAQAASFLCSDAASFITGTALNIDGGIGSRLHDPV